MKKMMMKLKEAKAKAFTLVEMLVVLLIISVYSYCLYQI